MRKTCRAPSGHPSADFAHAEPSSATIHFALALLRAACADLLWSGEPGFARVALPDRISARCISSRPAPCPVITAARVSRQESRAQWCAAPLLIHYHIFKNAGTSFEWALERTYGDRFRRYDSPTPGGIVSSRELARLVRRRAAAGCDFESSGGSARAAHSRPESPDQHSHS